VRLRRTIEAAMQDHDVNEQLVQAAARKLQRRGAAALPMVDRTAGRAAELEPKSLLHLQRAAGNASVVALIEGARPISLQRDDAGSTTSATAAATKPDAGSAKAEVTINWGAEADSSTVTANSLEILKDVCRAAGVTSVTITSTSRDATNQARVMYDNLESKGVAAQKALYGDYGVKVIDVYVDLKAKKKTADEIRAGMKDKIDELGCTNVSKHCSDPKVLEVFDVGPSSIPAAKLEAFQKAAETEARISNYIRTPRDPGCHFEIKPK
jgi:hypothetical protein